MVFAKGASGLGILTGAAGTGALISASFVATRKADASPSNNLPSRVYIALLSSQVLVALISIVSNWPAMILLIGALGASSTMVGVSLQTQIQTRLSDEMRGRVMSLWVVTGFGMAAIGSIVLGAVVQLFGMALAATLSGGIGFLLLSALLFAPRGTFARTQE